MNLAIFVSGTGTNMRAIIKASKSSNYILYPKLIISSNKNAEALKYIQNINSVITTNTNKIIENLEKNKIDIIALAGYMKIIPKEILSLYPKKIINLHPSLLPFYRGLNAPCQSLQDKAKYSGFTIHLIDEKIDHGIIIKQFAIPILPNDSSKSLHKRIKNAENNIYPRIINEYAKRFI